MAEEERDGFAAMALVSLSAALDSARRGDYLMAALEAGFAKSTYALLAAERERAARAALSDSKEAGDV